MSRNVYLQLTKLEEAKKLWLEALQESPLQREPVPLHELAGRVLAEDVIAQVSSPAFHGAAMDGIAVLAVDTFGASEARPKQLEIGCNAFFINTGQRLPDTTNAVIMIEDVFTDKAEAVTEKTTMVCIEKAAFPWQHVRKMGEDMVATEMLLAAGTVVGAYELGALAAAGVLAPLVYEKPKVAIIPSGGELVPVQEATPELLQSGKNLPEFNSLVLSSLVRDLGGEPIVLPIVPDCKEAIQRAFENAAKQGVHLIAINAGSSAGSSDYTAEVIAKVGELWVHGVTIMPGKPTALGKVYDTPIIGVPGYPVSAIVSFEEFAQPLLAQWQNRSMPALPEAQAIPFQALASRAGMEECVRVTLGKVDGVLIAVPLPRGAGTVTSLSRADGILRIPADKEGLAANTPCTVRLIKPEKEIVGSLLAIGSHDNTLDLLNSLLRKKNPLFSLSSAHVGSMGGLTALRDGRCHLAGSHLLDMHTGVYNQSAIDTILAGIPVMQVRLVDREQGFIVQPGNPENITTIEDITREGITFINRQRGSGTRVLLDWCLQSAKIHPDAITGYEDEEYTHMNVAAAVLSGRATTGLGVRSAAKALGLSFVPLGMEEYDLIIPCKYAEDPRVHALLKIIRSDFYKEKVQDMGGYTTERSGEIIRITQ